MTEKLTWQVLTSSVAGTSHIKRGQGCQDAYYWRQVAPDILVSAVADGAGSATLADVGAKIAVERAVDFVYEILMLNAPMNNQSNCPTDDLGWQNLLLDALRAAQSAIAQTAEKLEVELRELATTLILVIATPEVVIGGQVGDGASVIGDRHEQIISLTMPDSGEHINETTFLIEENALDHTKIQIWHGQAKNLAIFSDGLQMLALKMPMATPHQPFFQPLFKFLQQVTNIEEANQQLAGFLRSPKVTERADDDLTLLLASLIEQE